MIEPAKQSKRDLLRKRDEWELMVFDSATLFTAIEVHGRAGRIRDEFATLPEAFISAAGRHACVYAVAPSGRSIVLDRADWPRWQERWYRNHSEQENEAMTITETTTEPTAPQGSVFLLTWNERGPGTCRVFRFPTRLAAEAYSYEELAANMSAFVIETEGDFSNRVVFSGSVLVKLYNTIANGAGSVGRFESLAYARERTFNELVKRFGGAPYTVSTPAPEPSAVPSATTKEKTMPKAKTTSTTRGRKPNVSNTAKITVVAAENPKRAGTAAYTRFALYRSGMKVSTFLEKGGLRIDLAYDAAKGYIQIDGTEAVTTAA